MSCYNQCAGCLHRKPDESCSYWEEKINYHMDTSRCEGFTDMSPRVVTKIPFPEYENLIK